MSSSMILALLLASTTQPNQQKVVPDPCSPKGSDICVSGKSWAEGLTQNAPRWRAEHPETETIIERAESNGPVVTVFYSIRHTREELEKLNAESGKPMDSYLGFIDSLAHRVSCIGPPLSIIAYGGIFKLVFSYPNGEHLSTVTISDCSAYVPK